MICRGARAQVFKTEINDILRHAPFSFTSRPSVINMFHAKHPSGGSTRPTADAPPLLRPGCAGR